MCSGPRPGKGGPIDPCARAIPNLLAELPSDKIGGMLAKTRDQLYHGVRDKGWSHVAARQYAVKFGDEVLEAIRASTFSTAGVRLQ